MEKRLILLSVLLTMCTSLFAQREHIVQKGETIESVAKKYGVRVDELEAANPIVIKYFYVSSPLVIPVHVPNEEEIRAMEEEKARLIALREQEEAEKAERRARRNRFWGGLFDAVAEAFVGKPNQPMVSSAYAPTVSSSSYTPQLAPMYNVNGTYICEPYYTPSPRMVQYNTQNVSTGPNPFNQQMTFTMIGEDKGPKIHFELIGDTEKKKQEYIDQYKKSHPNCSDDDANNAWFAKQNRELEQMQRQTEQIRQQNIQYQQWQNAQQQQNNNNFTTNTSTYTTSQNTVGSKITCNRCKGTGKKIAEGTVITFGLDGPSSYCDICKEKIPHGYYHGHVICDLCGGKGSY